MENYLLKFLFVITGLLFYYNTSAYDFEVDGIYYHIISTDELTVGVTSKEISNGYAATFYSGDVVVPTSVTYANRTFKVTKIEYPAFYNSKNLTSVSLPNTITEIDGSSFAYSGIEKIAIPASVETISSFAFGYCPNLKNVIIEDSSKPIYFSDHNSNYVGIFRGCPLTLLYIGRNFSVDIPNTRHSPFGFYDISTNVKIELGPNVTYLCKNMFAECKTMTSFTIPETVTEIGESAFSGCTKLTDINLPESLDQISDKSFYNCQSLEKISFPSKITNIANQSFYGCTALKEINFNISITSIGNAAFSGCCNIDSINLPARLSTIESQAFSNCSNLSTISIHNTTPPTIKDNVFPTAVYWTAKLNVPLGTSMAYKSATGWKNFENISEIGTSDDDVKKYIINVNVCQGGILEMLGKTISNTSFSATTRENEDVAMTIIPNEGYELESLIIDGEDVTKEVVNYSYKISSIDQNKNIIITFVELPVYLTIKNRNFCTISQQVVKGNSYTLKLNPDEGWQIESVSYNGKDVTSQLVDNMFTTPTITANSELDIVYKQTSSQPKDDVNGDGNVDSQDVLHIYDYMKNH